MTMRIICCAGPFLPTLLLSLLASKALTCTALLPCRLIPDCRLPSNLSGWKEWSDHDDKKEAAREILLLPFAATEALVPGQSREIVLKQGRFLELFDECMEDHDSVVGMALMGDDNFLETVVLCDIEDFDVRSGFRGKVTLDVTLRAVTRAKLVETTQLKPIMIGYCSIFDDEEGCVDLQIVNGQVDDIEILLQDLSCRVNDGDNDLRKLYDKAFQRTLETYAINRRSTSAEPGVDGKRSLLELTAASWAVFAVLSDSKACIAEAISSVNLTDRLQIGLKALLDEKFRLTSSISSSPVSRLSDGDSGNRDAASSFE